MMSVCLYFEVVNTAIKGFLETTTQTCRDFLLPQNFSSCGITSSSASTGLINHVAEFCPLAGSQDAAKDALELMDKVTVYTSITLEGHPELKAAIDCLATEVGKICEEAGRNVPRIVFITLASLAGLVAVCGGACLWYKHHKKETQVAESVLLISGHSHNGYGPVGINTPQDQPAPSMFGNLKNCLFGSGESPSTHSSDDDQSCLARLGLV
jgi:hypothetical protein